MIIFCFSLFLTVLYLASENSQFSPLCHAGVLRRRLKAVETTKKESPDGGDGLSLVR